MFINVMMKRDKTGFKRLIEALDNTGQKEIADELDPERESKPESWWVEWWVGVVWVQHDM